MGMTQRKVETIQWDAEGLNVQGKLISAEKLRFRDGGTNIGYAVATASGVVKVFRGSTQLNYMLRRDDVGRHISIKYLGEDDNVQVKDGMNKPKLFEVYVDDTPTASTQAPASEGITDEDIPF